MRRVTTLAINTTHTQLCVGEHEQAVEMECDEIEYVLETETVIEGYRKESR